jgi:uncharacterized protein YqgC (DUF456 family)
LAQSLLLFVGAFFLMLLGLLGAFLPVLPGVPLVWLGATLYGLVDGFHHLSLPVFLLLTVLGAAGTTAELWATQIGARAGGASGWSAFAGSCLGGLAMLFLGLPLALLAALAGVFGIEFMRSSRLTPGERRNLGVAARSSGGWLAGWVLSALAQFSVSVFMILIFFWAIIF